MSNESSTEPPVFLFTQDDCHLCDTLKLMLQRPLKGEFSNKIEVVHLQDDKKRFEELIKLYGVQRTPTLVNRHTQLRPKSESMFDIKNFLQAQ